MNPGGSERFDVAVIGAGAGGLCGVARIALELGGMFEGMVISNPGPKRTVELGGEGRFPGSYLHLVRSRLRLTANIVNNFATREPLLQLPGALLSLRCGQGIRQRRYTGVRRDSQTRLRPEPRSAPSGMARCELTVSPGARRCGQAAGIAACRSPRNLE